MLTLVTYVSKGKDLSLGRPLDLAHTVFTRVCVLRHLEKDLLKLNHLGEDVPIRKRQSKAYCVVDLLGDKCVTFCFNYQAELPPS